MNIVRYLKDKDGNRYKLEPPSDGLVPITRKINNKALSADINLNASDVKARAETWTPTASEVGALPNTTTHLSGDVPISRKINNKALSADITLTASDVGALTAQTIYDGDMNNLITVGLYRLQSNANLPGNVHFGNAIVIRHGTSDTIAQIAVGYNSAKAMYYRGGVVSGGVWTFNEWVKVYTDGNKPTASDVGAVPTSRKVNNKALTSNITLTASDVGTKPVAIQSSAPSDTTSLWAW